jgi:hypothetical protein
LCFTLLLQQSRAYDIVYKYLGVVDSNDVVEGAAGGIRMIGGGVNGSRGHARAGSLINTQSQSETTQNYCCKMQ